MIARAGVCLVVAACACGGDCRPVEVGPELGPAVLEVCAELATTAAERTQGLSGSPALSSDEGLLLVFPVEGEACIANEQVGFSIDVVYAGEGGEVRAVETFAAQERGSRCHPVTRRVLEVAAGVAAEVVVGHRLVVGE